MIQLRQYQSETINRLRESVRCHRNVILCSVTGSGKTKMAKWMIAKALTATPTDRQTGKILVSVQRRGLVENLSDEFTKEPQVKHGLIMAGCESHGGLPCQVASIDTMNSWYVNETYSGQLYDIVICDEVEAHFSKTKKFLVSHGEARESAGLSPAITIGLTATPQAEGLSDVFRTIVYGPSPRWLQEQGYASKYRYLGGTKGELEKLKKSTGSLGYTEQSIADAMENLAGRGVARDWLTHAKGRPTIGFFPRRQHARISQQELIGEGVDARYVDGETPDEERRELFFGLNNGEYDYLCNVEVVGRGTDIPAVSCIQLVTACRNKQALLQKIGRGARIAVGKNDCLVIDHGGSIQRLGCLWEDEQEWTLDNTTQENEEPNVRPVLECPFCGELYRGGTCSKCGYTPQVNERRQQGLVFDGENLVEIKETPVPKLVDNEKAFCNLLWGMGRANKTWNQLCRVAIDKGLTVPGRFNVCGTEYKSIPAGDEDGKRKISFLFPVKAR